MKPATEHKANAVGVLTPENIKPVTVRVARGALVWRHGRCFTPGDVLELTPDDANRQVWIGNVERV